MADALNPEQLAEFLRNLRQVLDRAVSGLPAHEAFLREHCAAS